MSKLKIFKRFNGTWTIITPGRLAVVEDMADFGECAVWCHMYFAMNAAMDRAGDL